METTVAQLEQRPGPTDSVDASSGGVEAAVTVIEPTPGWRAIDFAELWKYRELVYFLTWRDIKVRYKQTVMGAAWAVLQPLLTSAVFVVLFGVMGKMRQDTEIPYLALVFAGQMGWQFFQTAVSQSGQSLVTGANLISKVYFPRLIIPIAAVGAGLVDFGISFGVMAVILMAYSLVPPVQLVLIPLIILGIVMTAIGVGSLLAALTVAYRDFRYVIPFLLQIWMLATPVGYSMNTVYRMLEEFKIDHSWMTAYFFLNPMAGFVQGLRWCLLNESLDPRHLGVSVISSILLLVIGTIYFRRVERRFADIV